MLVLDSAAALFPILPLLSVPPVLRACSSHPKAFILEFFILSVTFFFLSFPLAASVASPFHQQFFSLPLPLVPRLVVIQPIVVRFQFSVFLTLFS